MTLRHLRIFTAVCQCGSATEAARRLYMTQPAVSLAISELESHYGVRLFDRISRRLHITEPGRQLLARAGQILDLIDQLEEEMPGGRGGRLRIGASITVGSEFLPGCVERFSAAWPEVEVQVRVDSSETIEGLLLENRLDMGLMDGPARDGQLAAHPFLEDELGLFCRPGHPLLARQPLPPGELARQPLLLREAGSGARKVFESALITRGMEVSPAWESSSTRALKEAARQGLGIAVLPVRLAAEELASGALCRLAVEGMPLVRSLCAVYHKNKYLTPAATAFLEICTGAKSGPAKGPGRQGGGGRDQLE